MAPKDNDAGQSTPSSKSGEENKEDAKKKDEIEDTLSEEDRQLKDRLETCVSTITNERGETTVTIGIRQKALDMIVMELRSSTSSMTSVPKPLKFLRPYFGMMKSLHNEFSSTFSVETNEALEFRARVADVLAVLAMTMGKSGVFQSTLF
jgi:26S proteasome regulatory subunit N1